MCYLRIVMIKYLHSCSIDMYVRTVMSVKYIYIYIYIYNLRSGCVINIWKLVATVVKFFSTIQTIYIYIYHRCLTTFVTWRFWLQGSVVSKVVCTKKYKYIFHITNDKLTVYLQNCLFVRVQRYIHVILNSSIYQ